MSNLQLSDIPYISTVETVETVETIETVEAVETVQNAQTVQTVQTVEAAEAAETVYTEDLKKYDSLTYLLTYLLTDNLKARDASASKKCNIMRLCYDLQDFSFTYSKFVLKIVPVHQPLPLL